MIKTIFLDMDGVMVDFLGGLHRSLGVPYDINDYPYEKGKWNMLTDIRGFDDIPATFEQCNDACTKSFWANLQWTSDGHDILRAVTYKFAPTRIHLLTTCMPNPETKSGKIEWVERHLPMYLDRTIILGSGMLKGGYAKPDALLIDDCDKNIDEFITAGGRGLLVPRPWNRAHFCADRTYQVVKDFLEALE